MRFMAKRNFKGFNDWVEIFQAGEHTDGHGRSGTWSESDLDQMVANHNAATAAPLVIGHPETNDPAYGWVEQVQRVGKSLMAKFKDVVPQFERAVESGRYRKRSVSIGKGPDGWRLLHVGFLGAKPPALDLAPMNYEQPDDVERVFEFEADWQTPNVISRAMRRLREFLIEQFGRDAADRVMPDHDIEFLDEHADDLRNRQREGDSENEPAFSAPAAQFNRHANRGGRNVPQQFTQEDLDRAVERAKGEVRQEFERKSSDLERELTEAKAERFKAEFSAELDKLQDEGKLTPAQAEGALEFMLSLAAEPQEFEFSAADGKSTAKKDRLDWFREFVKSLPRQVSLGQGADDDEPATPAARRFNAPAGTVVDSDRLGLHEKALAYARDKNITYYDAVRALEQEA